MYGEEEYLNTHQSRQRAEWAAAVRRASVHGRRRAGGGSPAATALPLLDPPPRLCRVSLVLVAPLRPRTVGTVARLCACFEALDLRLVAPRCDHMGRPALSASKGAQYVLRSTGVHATLGEALAAARAKGVAFTRWTGGSSGGGGGGGGAADGVSGPRAGPTCVAGVRELLATREVAAALRGPDTRIALVFGREEWGLADEEVAACSVACALPMGRLAESLSLSHAAAIALDGLFSAAAAASHPAAGDASDSAAKRAAAAK